MNPVAWAIIALSPIALVLLVSVGLLIARVLKGSSL